jgi:hypothetical protein
VGDLRRIAADLGEDRPRRASAMQDDAAFLRAQAEKCRWLADRINVRDVVDTLLQMARDYEERAAKREEGDEPPRP